MGYVVFVMLVAMAACGTVMSQSSCSDFNYWQQQGLEIPTKWCRAEAGCRMGTPYPNPVFEVSKCGRCGIKSYICDPNGYLDQADADQLDQLIWSIQNHTKCLCSDKTCTGKRGEGSARIGIALWNETSSEPKNQNDAKKDPAYGRLDETNLFAYTLLKKWKLGQCENDMIIAYSAKNNVFFTTVSEGLSKYISSDRVGDVSMNVRKYFQPTRKSDLYHGLREMLLSFRQMLDGDYSDMVRAEPQVAKLRSAGSGSPAVCASVLTLMAATFVHFFH